MSERVIPSDAVVCIDRFSWALVRKYRARMIPGQPVFLDRDKAMEVTTAYSNSKEGGDCMSVATDEGGVKAVNQLRESTKEESHA